MLNIYFCALCGSIRSRLEFEFEFGPTCGRRPLWRAVVGCLFARRLVHCSLIDTVRCSRRVTNDFDVAFSYVACVNRRRWRGNEVPVASSRPRPTPPPSMPSIRAAEQAASDGINKFNCCCLLLYIYIYIIYTYIYYYILHTLLGIFVYCTCVCDGPALRP